MIVLFLAACENLFQISGAYERISICQINLLIIEDCLVVGLGRYFGRNPAWLSGIGLVHASSLSC